MTPELYYPVLDCFLRGLPHAYRDIEAAEGTRIRIEVTGDCGGMWFLERGSAGWRFGRFTGEQCAARVVIGQEIAWRVFTKGIDRDAARSRCIIEGDRALGAHVLSLTAIVGASETIAAVRSPLPSTSTG